MEDSPALPCTRDYHGGDRKSAADALERASHLLARSKTAQDFLLSGPDPAFDRALLSGRHFPTAVSLSVSYKPTGGTGFESLFFVADTRLVPLFSDNGLVFGTGLGREGYFNGNTEQTSRTCSSDTLSGDFGTASQIIGKFVMHPETGETLLYAPANTSHVGEPRDFSTFSNMSVDSGPPKAATDVASQPLIAGVKWLSGKMDQYAQAGAESGGARQSFLEAFVDHNHFLLGRFRESIQSCCVWHGRKRSNGDEYPDVLDVIRAHDDETKSACFSGEGPCVAGSRHSEPKKDALEAAFAVGMRKLRGLWYGMSKSVVFLPGMAGPPVVFFNDICASVRDSSEHVQTTSQPFVPPAGSPGEDYSTDILAIRNASVVANGGRSYLPPVSPLPRFQNLMSSVNPYFDTPMPALLPMNRMHPSRDGNVSHPIYPEQSPSGGLQNIQPVDVSAVHARAACHGGASQPVVPPKVSPRPQRPKDTGHRAKQERVKGRYVSAHKTEEEREIAKKERARKNIESATRSNNARRKREEAMGETLNMLKRKAADLKACENALRDTNARLKRELYGGMFM